MESQDRPFMVIRQDRIDLYVPILHEELVNAVEGELHRDWHEVSEDNAHAVFVLESDDDLYGAATALVPLHEGDRVDALVERVMNTFDEGVQQTIYLDAS